ncbi:putative ATPase AAA [Cupriavidus taiwanensis]|uniref:ATPase AAA n=1 Tax=Cupriavidus taiwanensis TaxID=164546 RepID=A0A976AX01_9BURK|nr:NB-ARC domain-containing protein [Cupriavidus taiwanensis]SOZ56757.1 putative ATPase AAA [Cupriavidus taiwanensis]SOZ57382.1 putative ATPase AAA [Cupriavidus taiwanensis]SOZ60623.1 putative ATPase AAA [Cupriavidus taiwanensis]
MKRQPDKKAVAKAVSSIFVEKETPVDVGVVANSGAGTMPNVDPQRLEAFGMVPTNAACGPAERQQDWSVEEIKKKVSELANQGRLSSDVLNLICKDGVCAPVEFELLDYKEDFDNSPYGKGKLILRVVSFFNSFGGYLIFGVRETESELRFDVVGANPVGLDVESIKASIKEYTGERIQISAMSLDAVRADGILVKLWLLHIPQRPQSTPPLHFLKDGPGNDRKKPVFTRDSVYCRRADECVEAKGPRILDLNGERKNPYLEQSNTPLTGLFRVNRIHHNLPDRNFICPRFVGRDAVVNTLWRWLGDDLSYVRVLAGEGGLGKSSIAYEFAERVSETPNVPFEQVVWLTAKERQFKAFDDQYVRVPERHYTSYEELLVAMCTRLPFTTNEVEGASVTELKRMLKRGLVETPSLLIVDDVDSLTAEEQRQVLELGMMLGSNNSRILLTTRYNQSFSNDNVIKLSGFYLAEEFPLYLEALRERLQFPELSASEIEKIHATSGGSPLFAESLLRLLRWHNVSDAIAQWKGDRGAAVRAAALKREIELLSPEAQRILLTVALLGEASTVELCEVLGYPGEIIEGGLSELVSLFLVAAPALASVPRFRIPDNTRRLVVDPTSTLVTDRARLERDILAFRKKDERTPNRDRRVAAAISQAASFVRIGDINSALATIKDARRKTQDHYDLLSYQATLHLKEVPPQTASARTLARKAYTAGCRKAEVLECWFEAEWMEENYIGALEAAEAALANKSSGMQDWVVRKSAALASKASDQARTGSVGNAVTTMCEASEVLRQGLSHFRRDDAAELESRQADMHDQIWLWTSVEEQGLGRTVAQLDVLEKFWRLGDIRITNLRRMLSAMDGMASNLNRGFSSISGAQKNLCSQILSRGETLLGSRRRRFPSDSRHKAIETSWEALRTRVDDILARSDSRPTANQVLNG